MRDAERDRGVSPLSGSAFSKKPRIGSRYIGFVFIAPSFIIFCIFVLLPLIACLVISFLQYDILTPATFVGIDNYYKILQDDRFPVIFLNTCLYVFSAVLLMNSLGVILALKLNTKMRPRLMKIMRSIFFFPSMIGLIYVGTIWASLFQEETGIINYYLHFLGLGPIDWLNGKSNAIFTVIFVDVWRNVGFGALIFLAALQDVPQERIEAAQIDGATKSQVIRYVTIPAIAPAIFFNVTMTLIGSFQIYESIVVLTNGGPGDSTRSLVMYIAEVAFGQFNLGYASALSVLLFVLIFGLTLFFFRLHRKWVTYD